MKSILIEKLFDMPLLVDITHQILDFEIFEIDEVLPVQLELQTIEIDFIIVEVQLLLCELDDVIIMLVSIIYE